MPKTLRGGSRPHYLTRLYGRLGFGGFAVFVAVGLATRLPGHTAAAILGALIALGAAAPLFLVRPPFPLAYAAVATAGVVVLAAIPSDVAWFAVAVLGAWCVLSGGVRVGLAYLVGILLVFGGEWLIAVRDPGWADWAAGVTFTLAAATLVRHELVLVERLRAAQAGLADRSRIEERNRIARELHDIIAHSLTVSLLHVTAARLSVEYDPPDAARALAEAERLGRQSLAEVRATMGVLRPEATEATEAPEAVAAPVPGMVELPRLVGAIRAAGADVSLTTQGDVGRLPATTGSMIYRVVQEALTNALRHAPGAAVVVSVAVQGDRVEVDVDSAGAPRFGGAGLGLVSMRERVQAVGGTCSAGPGGRGWLVHAAAPLQADLARDP